MTESKIANRQLWFMLFMLRSNIIIAFLPALTSADALQDAWISAVLTLVGSEVFVLLITLLDRQFPQQTIIEYSQQLLGKWPGRLLGLAFLWLFLQLSVVAIRIYGEVLATSFLPQTPLIFTVGSMVLVSTICVFLGIKILGRTADILFFFYLLMVLLIITIPLPDFVVNNIQPVLARGWGPALRGSLTPTALICQMWVITMISPTITSPGKIVRVSLLSVGVSLFILVILTLVTVGTLGPFEGARAVFPVLSLIRAVEISRFLQRTEVLLMFSWGFGLFISICIYLYSGAKGLAQWSNLKDYRAIIWPMAVIWVFLSSRGFEDIFALNSFLETRVFAPYGFGFLILPLLLLWTAYGLRYFFKSKGGSR